VTAVSPTPAGGKFLVLALCLALAVIVGLVAGILAALSGMNIPAAALAGGGAAGATLGLALTTVTVLRGW
jgi:hypothetical protein